MNETWFYSHDMMKKKMLALFFSFIKCSLTSKSFSFGA